jgi:hypothetical protein
VKIYIGIDSEGWKVDMSVRENRGCFVLELCDTVRLTL